MGEVNEDKSIQIKSNNIGFGPLPQPEDEEEQHLTISATGGVWLSRYSFGRGSNGSQLTKKERARITEAEAQDLFDMIQRLFENYDRVMVTDVGTWELEVRCEDGTKQFVSGSLVGLDGSYESKISKWMREHIKLDGLFALDGEVDE